MAEQTQTILGAVPEDLWALFRETREQIKETGQQMKETHKEIEETNKRIEETHKRTVKEIEQVNKQIGNLGNRFGELIEHLVAPNIAEKFNILGYHFDGYSSNLWFKENGRIIAEFDIMLENDDSVIAVEVKAKPLIVDVKDHVTRMENLRRFKDRHHDSRKIYGAIAGAVMPDPIKDYARKRGFYVIQQTGDTVTICVPEGFIPRKW
jgi:hypothetical protein